MGGDAVGRAGAGAAALLAATLTAGCRPARPLPRTTPAAAPVQLLSSEGSEYAPVLRAAVRVRLTAESVVVVLDSGRVLAPGQSGPGQPPVMSRLRFAPVVASPRPLSGPPAGFPGALPGGTAWVVLAEGLPVAMADSLYVGVPRALPGARWALARPPQLDPRAAFLVLRVTGDALEVFGRGPDGALRVAPSPRLRVRVYACTATTLNGESDPSRAAALTAGYTAAC